MVAWLLLLAIDLLGGIKKNSPWRLVAGTCLIINIINKEEPYEHELHPQRIHCMIAYGVRFPSYDKTDKTTEMRRDLKLCLFITNQQFVTFNSKPRPPLLLGNATQEI